MAISASVLGGLVLAPPAFADEQMPKSDAVIGAAAQVHAESAVTFTESAAALSPFECINVSLNGVFAGTGCWSQDPGGDLDGNGIADPGDAIIAFDGSSDGWGIETRLSTGRIASTRGHTAPFWSPWATGDLTEGANFTMRVCLVQGTAEDCSPSIGVTA